MRIKEFIKIEGFYEGRKFFEEEIIKSRSNKNRKVNVKFNIHRVLISCKDNSVTIINEIDDLKEPQTISIDTFLKYIEEAEK